MKKTSYVRHAAHRDPPYRFFFQTVGNPTRWAIIQLLRQHGPRAATAVAVRLRIEQSRVSHNLRRLERCGFVTVASCGRERVYALNARIVEPLLRLVDRHVHAFCARVCCGGGKRELRAKRRSSPHHSV